tara:strand:+ start:170 stop:589 length:420 start_codon:yes stop_codon:yes gene_type:complete
MIRDFLTAILSFLGFSTEFLQGTNPFAILLFYIFSTEILVLFLSIFIWVFIRRGSLKEYERKNGKKNNGFPADMVRRADTDEIVHRYNMEDLGKMYKDNEKRGFISVVFGGILMPIGIIFGILYGSLYFGGDVLGVFEK